MNRYILYTIYIKIISLSLYIYIWGKPPVTRVSCKPSKGYPPVFRQVWDAEDFGSPRSSKTVRLPGGAGTGDGLQVVQVVHHRRGVVSSQGVGRLPSGKPTKNYGKSPVSMGTSTINGHFQ